MSTFIHSRKSVLPARSYLWKTGTRSWIGVVIRSLFGTSLYRGSPVVNILAVQFVLFAACLSNSPAIGQPAVDSTTLDGKVLFGYQGWFRTPGDGSNVGWSHWSRSAPGPE